MEVPARRQIALAMRWIVGYAQARKNIPHDPGARQ